MTGDRIIYFLKSYYLLVEVDETFEETMGSFVKTETNVEVQETLKEMKVLLDEKNDKVLEYILETNNEVKKSF